MKSKHSIRAIPVEYSVLKAEIAKNEKRWKENVRTICSGFNVVILLSDILLLD